MTEGKGPDMASLSIGNALDLFACLMISGTQKGPSTLIINPGKMINFQMSGEHLGN